MRRAFKRRDFSIEAAPVSDINTTPLIDVMLVLLIMLIITIPVQLDAVKVNMPVGNPPPPVTTPPVVELDIDASSKILWDGVEVTSRSELERHMTAAATETNAPEVHLRPDRHARYDVVAQVLSSAQRTGLTKIGVVGSEQFIR
ncbi:ExbD/TolR family protein [Burkholderia anthina]|uniref:ExbD/TolR family protein n=1 Tax=Burkholderia anthina TaxID=179879 RepID=UPI00158EF180|nr:biopolymer transporter ExbD [Burkholderia anthina]